jgi:hypothetical protein
MKGTKMIVTNSKSYRRKIARAKVRCTHKYVDTVDCTAHRTDPNIKAIRLGQVKKIRQTNDTKCPNVRAYLPSHFYIYKCNKCGCKVTSHTQIKNLRCPIDGSRMKQLFI